MLKLKQESAGKNVALLRHIILIPSKPVVALTPYFSIEAANTNSIVIGFTREWLEPTMYTTRGGRDNHHTTEGFDSIEIVR